MSKRVLNKILQGECLDLETGDKIKLPLKEVRIGTNVLNKLPEYIKALGKWQKILIVCDQNTHKAAGKDVIRLMQRGCKVKSLTFKNGVKPFIGNCKKIQGAAKENDLIIAVGSGTINDMCKYSSYELGIPYVCFATACSMNGYASSNVSIIIGKHRDTVKAHLPIAIYFDSGVIAKAPQRMLKAGFADLMCRPSTQADWLLSHYMLGTEYKETPFALVKKSENILLKNYKSLKTRNLEAIEELAAALVISGIGMHISGGSYPASQGEHMIAHYMETFYPDECKNLLHGEEIAVTTLTMLKMQKELLKRKKVLARDIIKIPAIFKGKLKKQVEEEMKYKNSNSKNLQANINKKWNSAIKEIRKIHVEYKELEKVFCFIGIPTSPEELGWNNERYKEAIVNARFLRKRFGFLDIKA